MQLGRTVGELEQSLSWRELLAWDDFFADRQDEAAKGKPDTEPPDLAGLSPQRIAAAFGARDVVRR